MEAASLANGVVGELVWGLTGPGRAELAIFTLPSGVRSLCLVDIGGCGVVPVLGIDEVVGTGFAAGGLVTAGVVLGIGFLAGKTRWVGCGGFEGRAAGFGELGVVLLEEAKDLDVVVVVAFDAVAGNALVAVFCVPSAVLFTACVVGFTAVFFEALPPPTGPSAAIEFLIPSP